MTYVGLVLLAYFVGSIPSAYIAGRLVKGVDIRQLGDGNVGAANVYREISPVAGVVVLLADVTKGMFAVVAAQHFATQPIVFASGIAVVVGHNWPVALGFRGGRGESTTIGVLGVLLPLEMALLVAICAVPFLVTRNTMLAGAILFAPLWFVSILTGAPGPTVIYSVFLPGLVGLTHLLKTRHLPREAKKNTAIMRSADR